MKDNARSKALPTTVDPDRREVLILTNPKSGSRNRRKLVQELATELTQRDFEARVFDDVEQLYHQSIESIEAGRLRTVVSAGGDGTVSMLVNRLPPETIFTVFPMGTANLLAKHVGAKADVLSTAAVIEAGNAVKLDVGSANGKLFLVVASCGFDADVVQRIHSRRRGHISYFSYLGPLVESIFRYRFPRLRIVADERELAPARWAFVCNLPEYAMGLEFVDKASGTDGMLDLCALGKGGFWSGLGYFFSVLTARHSRLPSCQIEQFERLVIEPADGENSDEPIPYEIDGDPGGFLPLEISVVPERFRVLVSI